MLFMNIFDLLNIKMLNWREIQLLRKKMTTLNLIRFLVESRVISDKISIEKFEEALMRMQVIKLDSSSFNYYSI